MYGVGGAQGTLGRGKPAPLLLTCGVGPSESERRFMHEWIRGDVVPERKAPKYSMYT